MTNPEALTPGHGDHPMDSYLYDGCPGCAPLRAAERAAREDEAAHMRTIDQRDRAEGVADGLANAIADYLGIDIGEHSNANDPWRNALESIAERAARQPATPDTSGLREAAQAALDAINELHGELGPDIDAPWHKHESVWRRLTEALR